MKATIHPQVYEATITCSCGQTFTASSTKQEIRIDVCSKCHPYFTGEHRFIDTKGRVEEFQKKQKAAAEYKATHKDKKSKKDKKSGQDDPKSLRELLGAA